MSRTFYEVQYSAGSSIGFGDLSPVPTLSFAKETCLHALVNWQLGTAEDVVRYPSWIIGNQWHRLLRAFASAEVP